MPIRRDSGIAWNGFPPDCLENEYNKNIEMTKESAYELQLIDCNCNDCGYLVRDLSRPPAKGKPTPISYGTCNKFKKEVTFIPATCSIETQDCFIHRKQLKNETICS